jgi:nicotinic acid phosphoribosyltransferase
LEKLSQLIAAGVNALEVVEFGARRREGAKWSRNVTAEKKQQQYETDEDGSADGEPTALIAHPALYSNY